MKLLFFNDLSDDADPRLGMIAQRIGHGCPKDGKGAIYPFPTRIAWYKGCQSLQDAIKRRIKRVLARFAIWPILNRLEPVLGVSLIGFRPPGLN